MGPYYYSTEFLFFKAIVNSKYFSILGTMLYFWLLKGMLRSIFDIDIECTYWQEMENYAKFIKKSFYWSFL